MDYVKAWLWILGWYGLPSYGIGSIPYGYLFGRFKGIDLRKYGSGNIGATNVWWVMGKGWGIATFALDFAKVPLSAVMTENLNPSRPSFLSWEYFGAMIPIFIFLGAVLGHNYPIWLKFKGGKGIATSAGGLLWLMPKAFLVVLIVWVLIFVIFRYVSLASMCGAVALPIVAAFFYSESHLLLGLSLVLGVMAISRHRSNIQRLFQGTEHRWDRRDKEAKNGGGNF